MAPPRDVTGEGRVEPQSSAQPCTTPGDEPPPEENGNGIITETLQTTPGSSFGFEIEGGSDTPLNYIYIKSLVPSSPADKCGRFSIGDQLIMVGESCLIGMTHHDAEHVLDSAPAIIEVVAQRKPTGIQQNESQPLGSIVDSSHNMEDATSPINIGDQNAELGNSDDLETQAADINLNAQNTDGPKTQDTSMLGSADDLKTQDTSMLGSADDLKMHDASMLGSTDNLKSQKVLTTADSIDIFVSDSNEDLKSTGTTIKTRHTDPHGERHVQLCPEETMTVELTRGHGEKLGVGIVGGSDNPKLRDIHVSLLSSSIHHKPMHLI